MATCHARTPRELGVDQYMQLICFEIVYYGTTANATALGSNRMAYWKNSKEGTTFWKVVCTSRNLCCLTNLEPELSVVGCAHGVVWGPVIGVISIQDPDC